VKKPETRQLDLFGTAPAAPPALDAPPAHLLELARHVPAHVRLGTSSWTFPGWSGIVYRRHYANTRAFTRDSLSEYAAHPLFGTVGIDRSHYAPLTSEDLESYAAQLPEGFRCVLKVWDELTTMVFPDHPRYGARRAQQNPSFLDAARFRDEVAAPLLTSFREHTGPLVLEVAPMRKAPPPRAFEDALERFLRAAPPELHYAVELRNRELLTPRYLGILKHYAASHVLNYWTLMPTIAEQLTLPEILPGPFVVSRLLLPPYHGYEQRKRDLSPFDRVLDPQPQMRDDVIELARRVGELGHVLFVLVNNKAEGSAPLTIKALAERWAQEAR
jgi:uncharacterized protein YecE (DUF72 family)